MVIDKVKSICHLKYYFLKRNVFKLGGYAPYDTYETKDGKFMACGSLEPQFHANLLKGTK
jgi:crotonobetainyl-CoA:carnitine CoA-transferase CaiB-like acyl-CoA transferase